MRITQTLLTVAAVVSATSVARADVSLPKILSDGCVLQRSVPIRLWGTAEPGERVIVAFTNTGRTVNADAAGRWSVTLPPQKAGGPFSLRVVGRSNAITLKDIYIGEVWVCSGQSNMEWPLSASFQAAADIAKSADPGLRMFTVPKSIADRPQSDLEGGAWQSASPQTSGGFSAVGYYFAKALRKSLNVPVGMIHTSWGGTRIEAWTPRETLVKMGTAPTEFRGLPDTSSDAFLAARAARDDARRRWVESGSPRGPFNDPGRAETAKGWEAEGAPDSAWKIARAPGEWESQNIPELAGIDGGVWFRKTIDVPAGAAGQAATLSLGAIDDADEAFVNGKSVGKTGPETPNSWQTPRNYKIPAGVLKAGKNTIAVRIWDNQGGGGFMGPAESMKLTSDGVSVPLSGDWKFAAEIVRPAEPSFSSGGDPNAASGLYNAMLAPLAPYNVRGMLWYQGEANVGRAPAYAKQLPAMITDWRNVFQAPDAFFFAVQLAPWKYDNPNGTGMAELIEAQAFGARSIPNADVAVSVDLGDTEDIHPTKKAPIGERLARLALRDAYKVPTVARGPRFKDVAFPGDGRAIVSFAFADGGLSARDGFSSDRAVSGKNVVGFELAGKDGVFAPAVVKLSGNKAILSSADVPEPVAVRYGFRNVPLVNLFNGAGLPAEPFRTDLPKYLIVESK